MRLVCYSVLEIVPAHVWQNADCHLQSCHNQGHFATLVPLRGCYAMLRYATQSYAILDSATPSSANSAARQALVLFFLFIGGYDDSSS